MFIRIVVGLIYYYIEVIDIDFNNDDISRYKKKKQSHTSKSKSKSNHKHKYKDCLLICDGHPHKASYCVICSKIQEVYIVHIDDMNKVTKSGYIYYEFLNDEEIYEKYRDLEKIFVDKLDQKYIPINS